MDISDLAPATHFTPRHFLWEVKDGVALLTINRPERKNPITFESYAEMRDAFRRGSLVPVEVPELDLRRQFCFVWHRQKHQSAAMREFIEQCQALTQGVSRSDLIQLPTIA